MTKKPTNDPDYSDDYDPNDYEDDEPEHGDLVTYDHEYFYSVPIDVFSVKLKRKFRVRVDVDESWQDAVKAYMDREQFWPNVWFISDHGNAHLLSLENPDEDSAQA